MTLFWVLMFILVISSPKQCWFYLSSSIIISFWTMETIFTGTQTQDGFSGLWSLLLYSSHQNKQLWSWCHSSIMHSFVVVGTTLTRTWIEDLWSFDPSKIPFWFYGIGMPSLIQIDVSVLELLVTMLTYVRSHIHTYAHTHTTHTCMHACLHAHMHAHEHTQSLSHSLIHWLTHLMQYSFILCTGLLNLWFNHLLQLIIYFLFLFWIP